MGEQLKTITEPQVRFRGFTDEWEQVKVADIFNVTRGKVLSKDLVSVDKSDDNIYPVYSSQTSNDGLMGYYNEYLFDKAITWTTDGANAGTVNYRGAKFYSTNVNGVLLSDEGYVNQCVAEILNKIAWKYVSKVGNPKLMNNIMSDIPITIPHIEEQQKIGNLFQILDALAASSNEQVENLNQQKQALLQRLFPQKGETVPQVRLDGFSDAWEEVKLGDVVADKSIKLGRGKVIAKTELNNEGLGYPVYSSSTVNKGLMGYSYTYDFSNEMITWSIDGGGHFFYRHDHHYSITNVSGYMLVDDSVFDYKYLSEMLELQRPRFEFDYQNKAHPSVIKTLYRVYPTITRRTTSHRQPVQDT